jgi:hypothetical protein
MVPTAKTDRITQSQADLGWKLASAPMMRLRSDCRRCEFMSSSRGRGRRAPMPCSHFHETRASVLGVEEVGQTGFESFPRRHYPDRVRGYLLSPTAWSTPVSMLTIETPSGLECKSRVVCARIQITLARISWLLETIRDLFPQRCCLLMGRGPGDKLGNRCGNLAFEHECTMNGEIHRKQ